MVPRSEILAEYSGQTRSRCFVGYAYSDGLKQSAEVNADNLYEAAVLGCQTFREHNCEPAPVDEIRIKVTSSVVHSLTRQKLDEWLTSVCRSPKERATKDRLRALLAD